MKKLILIAFLFAILAACSNDEPEAYVRPDGPYKFVVYNDPLFSRDTIGPFSLLFYSGADMNGLKWSEKLELRLAPGEKSDTIGGVWPFVWVNVLEGFRMPQKSVLFSDSVITIKF